MNMQRAGDGIQEVRVLWDKQWGVGDTDHDNSWTRYLSFMDDLEEACTPTRALIAYLQSRHNRPLTSTLLTASFYLMHNTPRSFQVLHHLAELGNGSLLSRLRTLQISTILTGMELWGPFFSIWPHVEVLKIVARNSVDPTIAHEWGMIAPRGFQDGNNRILEQTCPRLRQLDLEGATVSRIAIPFFPSLTFLRLTNITWEGRSIFYLLRLVRNTLKYLTMTNVDLPEAEGCEIEDWERHILVKDPGLIDGHQFEEVFSGDSDDMFEIPAPIIFRALHQLTIEGEDTPPIFASLEGFDGQDTDVYLPTPVFVMPQLLTASFESIGAELDHDGEKGDGTMTTFGRNAPDVVDLSLYNSFIGDSIFYCLAAMNGRLQILNLSTTSVTDKLIAQLANIVPALKEIDVTGCDDISASGVARFVQLIRLGEQVPWKLERVKLDPPRWDADVPAWNWLDYINVLVRCEDDFEGQGPDRRLKGGLSFRRWKRNGKADALKVERRAYAERSLREATKLAEATAMSESRWGFLPGTQVSASGAPPFGRLPALPDHPVVCEAQMLAFSNRTQNMMNLASRNLQHFAKTPQLQSDNQSDPAFEQGEGEEGEGEGEEEEEDEEEDEEEEEEEEEGEEELGSDELSDFEDGGESVSPTPTTTGNSLPVMSKESPLDKNHGGSQSGTNNEVTTDEEYSDLDGADLVGEDDLTSSRVKRRTRETLEYLDSIVVAT
jgi:hypothetical protein